MLSRTEEKQTNKKHHKILCPEDISHGLLQISDTGDSLQSS